MVVSMGSWEGGVNSLELTAFPPHKACVHALCHGSAFDLCVRVCCDGCNQEGSCLCTYVQAAAGVGMTGGAYLLLATLQQGAVLTLSCRRVVCRCVLQQTGKRTLSTAGS
jgi:hypothetical protein